MIQGKRDKHSPDRREGVLRNEKVELNEDSEEVVSSSEMDLESIEREQGE
jgi:hypothetical protein